jgi:hypothetical protein
MSTQCSELYAYLKSGHAITTMIAMSKFGICRLSERIVELEAGCLGDPVTIIREPIHIDNRHGRRVRVMAYKLGEQ